MPKFAKSFSYDIYIYHITTAGTRGLEDELRIHDKSSMAAYLLGGSIASFPASHAGLT